MYRHFGLKTYTPELINLVRDLLTGTVSHVDTLIQATASSAFDQMTSLYTAADLAERQILRVLMTFIFMDALSYIKLRWCGVIIKPSGQSTYWFFRFTYSCDYCILRFLIIEKLRIWMSLIEIPQTEDICIKPTSLFYRVFLLLILLD